MKSKSREESKHKSPLKPLLDPLYTDFTDSLSSISNLITEVKANVEINNDDDSIDSYLVFISSQNEAKDLDLTVTNGFDKLYRVPLTYDYLE